VSWIGSEKSGVWDRGSVPVMGGDELSRNKGIEGSKTGQGKEPRKEMNQVGPTLRQRIPSFGPLCYLVMGTG
jgi:hypothetical protein